MTAFRYTADEASNAYAVGNFGTGDTVTVTVYKVFGGTLESLTTGACLEIGTTGVFRWAWSNLTTAPTAFSEYLYIMTNGVITQREAVLFGGYPDTIINLIGGAAGASVVTITVEETDTTPIPDVGMAVWNLMQTVLLRTAVTDASGQVILNLDDASYTVVLTKNQVNFDPTETLVVSGATSDTYNGEVLTIPVPATANVCRVSGFAFVQDSTGAVPSFDGKATIKNLPFNIDNIFYEGQEVLATFNATTGMFYWDLPYNAVVKLNSRVVGLANGIISVPPQAAASLNDLDIR
jgi:hypothetical protein